MMRFAVPIILSLTAITRAIQYHPSPFYSAASEAQIRFALENKYDDTGPGAKEPEYAFNTYKTLEEALIGYLDDPDTKLPEQDRNRAIQQLVKPDYNEYKPDYENQEFKRYYPKTVEEYTGFNRQKQEPTLEEVPTFSVHQKPIEMYKGLRQPQPQSHLVLTKLRTNPSKKYYQSPSSHLRGGFLKQGETEREVAEPYLLQKVKLPFRTSPLSVAHYARDPDLQKAYDQFDANPKYSFSYGVHSPDTGDSKSAQETREGGNVRGFYSFTDPDGKLRTVHYTADDKRGFRATVQREDNS